MLALGFGDWTFWETYDPANDTFGSHKVTFDGPNKLIIINYGVTEINFRIDVYSAWKEWQHDPNHTNAVFLEAVSVVGGEPLAGNRVLGTTFFLENGWRLRTWEGDHILTVSGNIFTREGDDPFVPTVQQWNTTVNLNTSTLVETIETGALIGLDTQLQLDEVWKLHGLDANNQLTVTPSSRTAGPDISQTITNDGNGRVDVSRD